MRERKYISSFLLIIIVIGVLVAGMLFQTTFLPDKEIKQQNYIVVLDDSQITREEIVSSDAVILNQMPIDSWEILEESFPYLLVSMTEEEAALLQKSSYVHSIEVDMPVRTAAFSNDVFSDVQWALQEKPGVNAAAAWKEAEQAKRTVVVAVIDTGVDGSHPDLQERMWFNPGEIPDDGIDNDGNGYVDDLYGWDFYHGDNTVCHYSMTENGEKTADPTDSDNHGTHVAGIIAAAADNEIGIAGVAGKFPVKIMSLKALGGGSDNAQGTGSTFQTIRAIQYATSMGADICNISWGNDHYSSALEQAIRESDMLFVAAAGNTGTNNNSHPVYPASYDLDNVISVAGSDRTGAKAAFSNYGTGTVDLAAPAEDIVSTVVGNYGVLSGTSMAAPHVSAIAAMLYTTSEYLYPQEVKEMLVSTGQRNTGLEGYLIYPVIPDAGVAMHSAVYMTQDSYAPELEEQIVYEAAHIEVKLQATDLGGSGIRTIRYIFGKKELSAFKHGTGGLSAEMESADSGTAILSKPGKYTFYVSDYAGNESIRVIPVTQIPSEELQLVHSRKTMKVDWTYQLKYTILPEKHTDAVTFISSDEDILQVNKRGVVSARKPGRAYIDIQTASGLSARCYFTVRKNGAEK